MERAANSAAGLGSGVLVAWLWNAANPDMQMPAEVAAAIGGIVGPVIDGLSALRRALFARWIRAIESVEHAPTEPA